MTCKKSSKTWLVFVPAFLAFFILAGCAAKTANVWGDPQTGLILEYRMAENQELKYESTAEQTQNIEVMGQSIDTETSSKTVFSVKSKGLKENNHQLGITIDSMSLNIVSMQGEINPDMSSVMGKSFEMTLSSLGKELALSGAESIKYDLGQGGERSIESDFQATFPDLAGKPVKIGDTWTSKDTITEKGGNVEIRINLESLNTLEGFETIDGLECVRVKAKVTGTVEGKGEEGGMDLVFEGELEGTETWYFAYKEGIFVKTTASIFVDATITASGPQDMTIPMKQEMKMEAKLIK